jgi:hypothetical protein
MNFSKILDSDMSPLGFDATKLYNFIGVRFKGTTAKVQEQSLTWIQVTHLQFNSFDKCVISVI